MLDFLKTIILGIVEGITEWLPISSTGHLIIFEKLLHVGTGEAFQEMFNVVIQLGAILAVVLLFFPRIWPFHGKQKADPDSAALLPERLPDPLKRFAVNFLYTDRIIMWLKILVSLLPSVIIGLPLDDWLDAHLHKPIPIALMLILYGVLFIVVETFRGKSRPRVRKISQITWRDALIIGLFQALALIPGTSRSGATIIGALLIGFSRTLACEYTFILAIPTMLGASAVKLLKFGGFTGMEVFLLLTGMIAAFVVSLFVIRAMLQYIRRHNFRIFGFYRIILGVVVLILAATGKLG